MEYIYCDESGETSFSLTSSHKHFLICALVINNRKIKKLINTIKRKETYLYNHGWPKNIEIKANTLHMMKYSNTIPDEVKSKVDGDEYIENILMSVIKTCTPRIDYFVVNKTKFTNESFKKAPYGIAYNFFAGKILVPLCVCFKDTFIIMDQRSKELHDQKHFDGYIETKVLETALQKDIKEVSIDISHETSISNAGLRAVDFFAWSIYRKFESKDERFYNKIHNTGVIKVEDVWYCK